MYIYEFIYIAKESWRLPEKFKYENRLTGGQAVSDTSARSLNITAANAVHIEGDVNGVLIVIDSKDILYLPHNKANTPEVVDVIRSVVDDVVLSEKLEMCEGKISDFCSKHIKKLRVCFLFL